MEKKIRVMLKSNYLWHGRPYVRYEENQKIRERPI